MFVPSKKKQEELVKYHREVSSINFRNPLFSFWCCNVNGKGLKNQFAFWNLIKLFFDPFVAIWYGFTLPMPYIPILTSFIICVNADGHRSKPYDWFQHQRYPYNLNFCLCIFIIANFIHFMAGCALIKCTVSSSSKTWQCFNFMHNCIVNCVMSLWPAYVTWIIKSS